MGMAPRQVRTQGDMVNLPVVRSDFIESLSKIGLAELSKDIAVRLLSLALLHTGPSRDGGGAGKARVRTQSEGGWAGKHRPLQRKHHPVDQFAVKSLPQCS